MKQGIRSKRAGQPLPDITSGSGSNREEPEGHPFGLHRVALDPPKELVYLPHRVIWQLVGIGPEEPAARRYPLRLIPMARLVLNDGAGAAANHVLVRKLRRQILDVQ